MKADITDDQGVAAADVTFDTGIWDLGQTVEMSHESGSTYSVTKQIPWGTDFHYDVYAEDPYGKSSETNDYSGSTQKAQQPSVEQWSISREGRKISVSGEVAAGSGSVNSVKVNWEAGGFLSNLNPFNGQSVVVRNSAGQFSTTIPDSGEFAFGDKIKVGVSVDGEFKDTKSDQRSVEIPQNTPPEISNPRAQVDGQHVTFKADVTDDQAVSKVETTVDPASGWLPNSESFELSDTDGDGEYTNTVQVGWNVDFEYDVSAEDIHGKSTETPNSAASTPKATKPSVDIQQTTVDGREIMIDVDASAGSGSIQSVKVFWDAGVFGELNPFTGGSIEVGSSPGSYTVTVPDSGTFSWGDDVKIGAKVEDEYNTVETTTSQQIPEDTTAPKYDLSVSTNGLGSVDGVPSGDVEEGSTVTLTANSGSGYTFEGWSGDVPSGSNDRSITLTIDSDTSVTAEFDKLESGLSVDVQSINGESSGPKGYHINAAVRSISVKVTDDSGTPVTGESLELNLESKPSVWVSLNEQDDGVYQFTGPRQFATRTKYVNISVRRAGTNKRTVTSVPVISDISVLEAPIEGWAPQRKSEVRVDDTSYVAVQMIKDRRLDPDDDTVDPGDIQTTWLAFKQDGTLVTDPSLRRKIAMTAHVDYITRKDSSEDVRFLRQEYPDKVGKVLTYSEWSEFLFVARDTGAELLGTIGGAVVTGGSNVAAKASVKASMKATGKKFAKDVLKNYIKEQIPGTAKNDPLAAFEKGIKWKTRTELEAVQSEAQTAGDVLSNYIDGETWTYEDANEYWRNYNASVTDGPLYMELRTNMLPSADPRDQLQEITEKTVEGATGVPVDLFVSTLTEDRLGYISQSFEETARSRTIQAMEAKAFGTTSQRVQQQAYQSYGNNIVYASKDATVKSASISLASEPTGEYIPGEQVTATVEVTNTGNTAGRFFVGYSVQTTVDGETKLYDNGGTTGHHVTLASGETAQTNVTWIAQSSSPSGQEYGFVTAVWPTFPESGVEQLDRVARSNTFTLADGSNLVVQSLKSTNTSVRENTQTTIVADVTNNGDIRGSTLLNLTSSGTVVDQEVVSVGSGNTSSAVFTASWDEPGDRMVQVGSESMAIDVYEANEQPSASLTYLPDAPKTGATISFDASGSTDADGKITQYKWDFDNDGTVEQTTKTSTTTHSYNTAGNHYVSVTVIDDDGGTDTDTTAVPVAIDDGTTVFNVGNTEVTTPVEAGSKVTIDTEITNTGDASGTQTVELLDINDNVVDTQTVTLDPGNQQSISLTWQTESDMSGSGDVTVRTDSDTSAVPVTVEPNSGTATLSGSDTTTQDQQTTPVSFTLTNTGEAEAGFILNVSLPDSWSVQSRNDAGGTWNSEETKWLWQTVAPGETVEPTLTVAVPETGTGTYEIPAQAIVNDGVAAETNATVEVTEGLPVPKAIDANGNGNGRIGDFEVLTAIDHWRSNSKVPDTAGKAIGDFQILEIIDMWRSNAGVGR